MQNIITEKLDPEVNQKPTEALTYEPGEQLADKITNKQEVETWLNDNLINIIQLRDMPDPYYGFNSLTDKWAEYDRLYECRAKDDRSDNKSEYQGNSNIVLSDFHARVEILKTREMNMYFSGTEMFNSRPTKESTMEGSIFAKRLVKYSINAVDNFKREIEKICQERLKYGTWFTYDPFVVNEKRYLKKIDYQLDEEGNPLIDMLTNRPIKTDPYWANLVMEEKFTDLVHWETKRTYIHPKIENIQDQECIFYQINKSYNQLLEMESKGQIAPGEANYIKENFQIVSGDSDLDKAEDKQQPDDNKIMRDEAKSFKLWYVLFRYTMPGAEKRCIYEAIYMHNNIRLCGLRKMPIEDRYPVIKGTYISIPGYAYGIGMGDIVYPACMAKNSRFNQVFDLQTFEIKGGGFKDSTLLPDFNSMGPGEFKDVPGLAAQLSSGGKPVLTWSELRGAARAGTAWDVIPLIDKNIEIGSGATDTLAGMPTNSQVDRTAAGLEQMQDSGNERINSYAANFGDELFVQYAKDAYDNYDKLLDKEVDLPKMFDEEELTYTEKKTGEIISFVNGDAFREISFNFLPVEKVIDAEKKLGKIQRLVGLLMQFGQASPRYAQLIEQTLDPAYLVTSVAEALDITDIDRLFPRFNPTVIVMDLQQKLQQAQMQNQMQNQMMQQAVEMVRQKLTQLGDQTAVNVINEVTQQMQEAMQNGAA